MDAKLFVQAVRYRGFPVESLFTFCYRINRFFAFVLSFSQYEQQLFMDIFGVTQPIFSVQLQCA